MNDEIKVPTMQVTPLKKICMTIGELPTSYLETMSYYEMLVWFTNYLRDNIIPVVNNNGEATHELQVLFTELQSYVNNYFDNLDVQDEINNKLDDMLEDGVLEQIIEQFLQLTSLICFDNVADMKLSVNLANGSYAKTLGYHNINDDGGATYKIRTITNDDVVDEKKIIALYDNTLVAELIFDKELNFHQIGGKGDGITDETAILKYFFESSYTPLAFNKDDIVLIDGLSTYDIADNTIINGNGAKILHTGTTISSSASNNAIMNFSNIKNLTINDLNLDGQSTFVQRPIDESSQQYSEWVTARQNTYQPWHFASCENLVLNNMSSTGCRTGFFFEYCKHLIVTNCKVKDTLADGFFVADCRHALIKKCYVYNSNDDCFSSVGYSNNSNVISYDVHFEDCYAESSIGAIITLEGGSYLYANNCSGLNTNYRPFKVGNLTSANTNGNHIYVTNCRATLNYIPVSNPNIVALLSSGGTGGKVKYVYFDNCSIDYTGTLTDLNLQATNFENLTLNNFTINNMETTFRGTHLTLNNCYINSHRGSVISNSKYVVITGCNFMNDNTITSGYTPNITMTNVANVVVDGGYYQTTGDYALSIISPDTNSSDIETNINGITYIQNTYSNVRVKPVTISTYGSLTTSNLKSNTLFFDTNTNTLSFYRV